MKKVVFFDLDKTLYSGYSGSDFIQYLSKKYPHLSHYGDEYIEIFKKYAEGEYTYEYTCQIILNMCSEVLKGMKKEDVLKDVKEMIDCNEERIYSWVYSLIESLKENDFHIVIVSGGPDIVVEFFATELSVDNFFASEIPRDDSVFTGKEVLVLNGEEKLKKVKEVIGKIETDISWAFGDSPGDLDMLKFVDKGFVVNDGKHEEMLELAKEYNWFVFDKQKEILPYTEKCISEINKLS